jgi:hypothetical protein
MPDRVRIEHVMALSTECLSALRRVSSLNKSVPAAIRGNHLHLDMCWGSLRSAIPERVRDHCGICSGRSDCCTALGHTSRDAEPSISIEHPIRIRDVHRRIRIHLPLDSVARLSNISILTKVFRGRNGEKLRRLPLASLSATCISETRTKCRLCLQISCQNWHGVPVRTQGSFL